MTIENGSLISSGGGGSASLGFLDDVTTTLYVRKGAAGGGDGSQKSPFNTIQAALDQVLDNNDASSSNPYLIDIGAGTWSENLRIFTPYTRLRGAGKTATILTATSGLIVYIGNATAASLDTLATNNHDTEANLNTQYTNLVADGSHDAMDGVALEQLTVQEHTSSVYSVAAIQIGNGLAADLTNGGLYLRDCRVNGSLYARNQAALRILRAEVRYQMEWRNIRSIYTEHATLSTIMASFASGDDAPSGVTLSFWTSFECHHYDDCTLDDVSISLDTSHFDDDLVINGPALLATLTACTLGKLELQSTITMTMEGGTIKGDLVTSSPGTINATLKGVKIVGDAIIPTGGTQTITLNGSTVLGEIDDDGKAIKFVRANPESSEKNGALPYLANWSLEEGSGTTINDDSYHGDNHPGTLSAGASWTTGDTSDDAITFDSGEYIDLGNATQIQLDAEVYWEICIKFKLSSGSGFADLLSRRSTTFSPGEKELYIDDTTGAIAFSSNGDATIVGTTNLKDDAWHVAVYRYAYGVLSMYVDGVMEARQTVTLSNEGVKTLHIGNMSGITRKAITIEYCRYRHI